MLNKEVLLLDNYNEESQMLHESLLKAGFNGSVVVLQDNGFLPKGVLPLYRLFCDYKDDGRARYFNEVNVPDYWEIKGDNQMARVYNFQNEKARIYYADGLGKRFVKTVDWLDEKGKVCICEHFDNCGNLYGKTILNKDGKLVTKSFYAEDGKEVLVENFVTKNIILNENNKVHIFKNKIELAKYGFKKLGLESARFFINSLSTPFFIVEEMNIHENQNILFWQEPIFDEIPGNMQGILRENSNVKKVCVQKRDSYKKLLQLGANSDVIEELGFIYDFKKNNKYSNDVLICTNSDQIEKCKEIVEALPELNFHIAAITEMSSKLMSMEEYKNVYLYPVVKMSTLDNLFMKCDLYLDINHGSEIVLSVKQAFLHNQLVLGFKETMHNARYTDVENIFESKDYEKLIEKLKHVISDKEILEKCLRKQREHALSENQESYKEIWMKE